MNSSNYSKAIMYGDLNYYNLNEGYIYPNIWHYIYIYINIWQINLTKYMAI